MIRKGHKNGCYDNDHISLLLSAKCDFNKQAGFEVSQMYHLLLMVTRGLITK